MRSRSSSRSHPSSYAAFTLIELLVVVAIIALLLSILLPSLERARAQARKIICLTNLRTQGQVARLYAEDNREFIGRGIQGVGRDEYAIYATTVLPGLGFDGNPLDLWRTKGGGGRPGPDPGQRRIREAMKNFGEQLNCPDFPDELDPIASGRDQVEQRIGTQLLDYTASAMPIPFPRDNVEYDLGSQGQPGDWEGVQVGAVEYVETSKLSEIDLYKSGSEVVYVTEAHNSLKWSDFAFHHFFLAQHLSTGTRPRMAADERHPGGVTGLFFDGHADAKPPRVWSPGWPCPLGFQLRWFSVIADPELQQHNSGNCP